MLHDESFVTGLLIGDKRGYDRGYEEGDSAGYDRGFEEGGGGASARDTIEFGSGMTVDIWKVPTYDDRPVNGSLDDTLPANRCQWTLWRMNYCYGLLTAIYGATVAPVRKELPGTLTKEVNRIYMSMFAKQDGIFSVFAESPFWISAAGNTSLKAWSAPMWLIVGPTVILCVTKPHAYAIPWVLWGFVFGQNKDGGGWRAWNGVGLSSDTFYGYNGTAGDLTDTSISPTIMVDETMVTTMVGNKIAKVENLWVIKNTNGIITDTGGVKVFPTFASVGTATKHPSGRRLLYVAHNITSVDNYGDIQNLYFILLPQGTQRANWRGLLDESIVNSALLPWEQVPGTEEDSEAPAYGSSDKQDSTPNSYYAGYNAGYEAGLAGGGGGEPDGSYDEGYQAGYQVGYSAGLAAGGSDDGYTLHPAADGATELYIAIEAAALRAIQLCFCQTVAHGVSVDWGDGSATETVGGTGPVYPTHDYNSNGDYVIRLIPAEGCELTLGGGTSKFITVFNGSGIAMGSAGCGVVLKKALVGDRVPTVGNSAFHGCTNLEEAYVPDGTVGLGQYCFRQCGSLHRVRLPSSLTTLGGGCFDRCYGVGELSIPAGVKAIGTNEFTYCQGLRKLSLPGAESIGASAFGTCYGLQRLDLPATLKTWAGNATANCVNLKEIHVAASVPPTLNANLSIPAACVIYIPAGSLAAYSAANYWKNIATRLIEE